MWQLFNLTPPVVRSKSTRCERADPSETHSHDECWELLPVFAKFDFVAFHLSFFQIAVSIKILAKVVLPSPAPQTDEIFIRQITKAVAIHHVMFLSVFAPLHFRCQNTTAVRHLLGTLLINGKDWRHNAAAANGWRRHHLSKTVFYWELHTFFIRYTTLVVFSKWIRDDLNNHLVFYKGERFWCFELSQAPASLRYKGQNYLQREKWTNNSEKSTNN